MEEAEWRRLGTFQLLVLIVISRLGDEAYGQNIASSLREKIPDLLDAQVYMALKRLEDRSLVQVKHCTHTGNRGRPRIVYEWCPSSVSVIRHILHLIHFMKKVKRHERNTFGIQG